MVGSDTSFTLESSPLSDSGVIVVVLAEANESFLEPSLRGVMSGVLNGVSMWEGVLTSESDSSSRFRSNFEGISRFVDSSVPEGSA